MSSFWLEISTHAPARGATGSIQRLITAIPYFNPRSREGSDGAVKDHKPVNSNFNPRSREGSDTPLNTDSKSSSGISTHAPARGATSGRDSKDRSCQDFNPRSREGSDGVGFSNSKINLDFNPRSREGSDQ